MWISNNPVHPDHVGIKRYFVEPAFDSVVYDEMASFTDKQIEYLLKRKEVINMGDRTTAGDLQAGKEVGYRQTDSCRRMTIAEQLDANISLEEASNVRLKKLQELQGLLERNKTIARILELQRELGY